MKHKIINLSEEQGDLLVEMLEKYDADFFGEGPDDVISIGIEDGGRLGLVAGLNAGISAFRIMYISTMWVDKSHRKQGLGRQLIAELEKRAKAAGANVLRADTFDFQGVEFYRKCGFIEAGSYQHPTDGYAEHFFVKYI